MRKKYEGLMHSAAVPLRPLLRERFRVPARSADEIERTSLLNEMLGASGERIVILHGPCGYGKTCLLRQAHMALDTRGAPVAWLSISVDQAEPARFLAYLVGSVRELTPKFGDAVLNLLDFGVDPIHGTLLAMVANDLNDIQDGIVIFLDGLELLRDPSCLAVLTALLSAVGPRVRFMIASRDDPILRLGLTSAQAKGEILAIDMPRLAFTAEEQFALLGDAWHRISKDHRAQAELASFEGWPAALQLFKGEVATLGDAQLSAVNFNRLRSILHRLFREQCLSQLSAEQAEWLKAIAVPDTFNPALASVVFGNRRGVTLPRELVERSLFCMEIDTRERWYRLHPLFRDFLLGELEAGGKQMRPTLLSTVADWCAQNGHPFDAVRYALHANDRERALERAGTDGWVIWQTGHESDLLDLIEHFSADELHRFPALLVLQLLMLLTNWQFEEAEAAFDNFQRALADGHVNPNDKFELETGWIGTMRDAVLLYEWMAGAYIGDVARIKRGGAAWNAQRSSNMAPLDAILEAMLAYADGLDHRYESLFARARRVDYLCEADIVKPSQAQLQFLMATSFLRKGDVEQSLSYARKAYAATRDASGYRYRPMEPPTAILVAALYDANDIAAASELIANVGDFCTIGGFTQKITAGVITAARLYSLEGKHDLANAALAKGCQVAQTWGFNRIHVELQAERLALACRFGDASTAAQIADFLGLTSMVQAPDQSALTGIDIVKAITCARFQLLKGDFQDVVTTLTPWLGILTKQDAIRCVIDSSLLLGCAYHGLKQRHQADRFIRQALELGATCMLYRLFLDLPSQQHPHLSAVCRRLVHLNEHVSSFCAHLLQALESETSDVSADAAGVADFDPGTLSLRELEILRMVSRGLSNVDIGRELGLTESTVKWYMQQVYDKIGVRQRTRAVYVARQLGLLN
jgi:LuxR family transcriptional regulator, maltose regulon positive regulatory protein